MKKLILLLSTICFVAVSYSQSNRLDSSYVKENYEKWERMIPMRDGKKLYTAIYIPKDVSEKHPILMRRTPYSSAPYGGS